MTDSNRRQFLRTAATTAGVGVMPASIARALAATAATVTGTIKDVQHVVILMQENRSFDHYFGTLKGVRGFGDRHPTPLPSGKTVWYQVDANGQEVPPFHLDTAKTSGMRVAMTPHSFSDSQGAWSQGRFGWWPKYKTPGAMGYYKRADIPFQFALAEAFTLCDAHHCSITSGTDPNRIIFFSGSNFNPAVGGPCTDADSEPDNLRCWIEGEHPTPGYKYAGSAFKWPTIPDVLEKAGVSWRIYQNPNDNWTGAMHGGLAFESFRTCKPGSGLWEKGMSHLSLEQLDQDVKSGTLPQVSWVLPSKEWSEHPFASTPVEGAEFVDRVLGALTANPEVWRKTVLFVTFDENDGFFDHAAAPAPPSYNLDGTLAGASTVDTRGNYFVDKARKYLKADDTVTGEVRPWGLGARVPMYVISPWSKGGWVNSQVFDHTSVGQFLEKRFGVHIPAISPWHRAVCGDLTSALDFAAPDAALPTLPNAKGASGVLLEHIQRPKARPPATPEPIFQEPGVRPSRALPYELHVDAVHDAKGIALNFRNTGRAGAVFHVYDRKNLAAIPRRYTVEAGKALSGVWAAAEGYDLWVLGPNGFLRTFRGAKPGLEVVLSYDRARAAVALAVTNRTVAAQTLTLTANAYDKAVPKPITVAAGGKARASWGVKDSGQWYDLSIAGDGFERRFAGRVETGAHGVSDPALGTPA
ncbi:MAG: phospholipase C, phosphocholine-specific [Rhodospirillaceae bacterium]|nr:phospholipase C, phosphocholine-specific [Rhodospirillaceae bacterium]